MGKIISVCSGCGGVGKSTIALTLALCAAESGRKTILLDASGIARSCDIMLGLESIVVVDMFDVVMHHASLQSALYPVPNQNNLRFACASLYEGVLLSELSGIILALRTECDLLVVDLPTGPVKISSEMMDQNDALLMITRPDDISIRALERTLSSMSLTSVQRHLIINRVDAGRIKRKLQYPAESIEIMLDLKASCMLYEEENLQISSGKRSFVIGRSIRSEMDRLLKQIL